MKLLPRNRDAARKDRDAKRVRTPTVLQMEAVECGAAALGSILAYYGRWVPLEELRIACGISRDGSKASNVVKAARTYGMVAKGVRQEPAGLRTSRLPVIVFWNFSHFLVVEGFRKDKVYINDPAAGPRTVSADDFDRSFTGVALTVEPGPDFQKGGSRRSIVAALRRRLAGSGTAILFAVAASLALVALQLVVPAFTAIFINRYMVGGLQDTVRPLLLAMAVVALLVGIVTWLQQRHLLRMETKMALTTSSSFFWHVLRLPIMFFTQRYAGEISSRVALNDTVAQLLSGTLATNVLGLVLIAFFIALMTRYDGVLTIIAIVIAALNILALRYSARLRVDQNQKLLQERGQQLGTALNGLKSIETLKASGSESDFFARWSGYQARVMNAEQSLGVSTQMLTAVPPLLMSLGTATILLVGGLRVIDNALAIGTLVAFQVLVGSFMAPITGLVNLGSQVQEVEGDMNRLDDVLRYPEDEQLHVNALGAYRDQTNQLTGHVEIRDVSFGYSRLEPALIEHFSLTMKPGSRVALVGASGSGKSTVAKLVTGLHRPWSGEILFDGTPRNEIPNTVITNSLAIANQEIWLAEGTVRDNLAMWDPTIPETSIVRAARDANMHEEISERPGGYSYQVEEDGRNFSGGQRQRLELARALAGDPTILVLDEATSALDPISEKIIDDNLRRRGCTCLIIAHRLSTIRDCDEILVLERGTVVERGTHDQLLRHKGEYARLMRAGEASKLDTLLEMLES
jgi:NHLM bacteriocin system ABC transporter peptidase/ATP-binding protein